MIYEICLILWKERKCQARITCPKLFPSYTFQLETTHYINRNLLLLCICIISVLANMTCTEEKKKDEAQYCSKILRNMENVMLRKGFAFLLSARVITTMKLSFYGTNMNLFFKQKYVLSTTEDDTLQRNGT